MLTLATLPVMVNDTINAFAFTFISSFTPPAHGFANVVASQQALFYRGNDGFRGVDSFGYCIRAQGSTQSNCATVTLLVGLTDLPQVPALGGMALAALSGALGWLGMRGRRRRCSAPALRSGVLYHSFVEPSGYGLAGIAYVRALVNAGVPVRWAPVRRIGDDVIPVAPSHPLSLALAATDDESLADLPALLAATSRPIAVDTVVAFTVPEHWPSLFRPEARNVGMHGLGDRPSARALEAAARRRRPRDRALRAEPRRVRRRGRRFARARRAARPPPRVERVHACGDSRRAPALRAGRRALRVLLDQRLGPAQGVPSLLRAFVHAFRADEVSH